MIANTPLSATTTCSRWRRRQSRRRRRPASSSWSRLRRGHDPLLRRPFSVFEVLRDAAGAATGFAAQQAHRRRRPACLYARARETTIDCLGPLGRPFTDRRSADAAWMVAGGVGLAPFAALAEALRARRDSDAVLRRAHGAELFYLDFSRPRRRAGPDDGRRQPLENADASSRRWTAGCALRPGAPARGVRVRTRGNAGRGARSPGIRAALPGVGRTHHGLRPRRLLQLRRAHARRRWHETSRPIVPGRTGAGLEIRYVGLVRRDFG